MNNGYEDTFGGTGRKLTRATIVVAGVASLAASLLSIIKNYRKPLLQRYVVRILLMVPIYSAASWASIISLKAAFWLDPIRDIYEAFTIYTFFQLLINFIGGERALIIMMHGREPIHHLWPLNYCLPKVDISDPHTFLAIKRGILQYAWLKPVLGLASIIMKATDTYQEGYIGLSSGYLWSGIFYNISVTLSLYSLGMFWVCMSEDLKPFRPVPKFLCVKLIIFASYWQGFFLSILVWLGAIPDDVPGYTPDNIAAALQDALICFEMPIFAVAHWYAFSWHDYADITISAARMPVKYALRDSFGIRDLIEDTKETFGGKNYEYRLFDSGDDVLAHEESASRVARMMEGMRYERGGKGKYWLPKPGEVNSRTPLLAASGTDRSGSMSPTKRTRDGGESPEDDGGEISLDKEDESLFRNAKALEFGDWNYPVITAHEANRERWLRQEPDIITTSTNRHLLQPTRDHRITRERNIKKVINKGKNRESSPDKPENRKLLPSMLEGLMTRQSSSSSSGKSDPSQRVDLIVKDPDAEVIERVRARKEGGAGWNDIEPRRYIKTYPDSEQGEEVREGFEPVGSNAGPADESDVEVHAEHDDRSSEEHHGYANKQNLGYGSFAEEQDAWGSQQ